MGNWDTKGLHSLFDYKDRHLGHLLAVVKDLQSPCSDFSYRQRSSYCLQELDGKWEQCLVYNPTNISLWNLTQGSTPGINMPVTVESVMSEYCLVSCLKASLQKGTSYLLILTPFTFSNLCLYFYHMILPPSLLLLFPQTHAFSFNSFGIHAW